MRKLVTHHRSTAATRGGFTLIEMLVATTLVVLMMLMFAQIYIAAIGSLGQQQATARNDGKARLGETLLRADLRRCSCQSAPGSNQGLLTLVNGDPVNEWQEGYFYFSENDQTNPTDDVLQFTIRISANVRNPDQSYNYGRCSSIPNLTQTLFPNHPDADDGDTSNGVGASRAAEVTYFVRNGNLYRRVLLLRDSDLSGVLASATAQPSNPSNPTPTAQFRGPILAANSAERSYYKAFDYSAYYFVDWNGILTPTVKFMGTDALENRPDAIDSIGRSMNRFGYAISPTNQVANNSIIRARGTPVEYDSTGVFFGRPTHAETGSWTWQWPGTQVNPLGNSSLTYDTTNNQLLGAPLPGGTPYTDPDSTTRATEDLLLANVEAFDVEFWDQGLFEDLNNNGVLDAGEDLNGNGFLDQASGFVQLGNGGPTGYFTAAQRLNADYGPGANPNENNPLANPAPFPARNWVFDTGHPDMWSDSPYQANLVTAARTNWFKPPYRPLQYRLTEDTNRNGTLDPTEDTNGNGILDPGEDTNGNGYLDLAEDRNLNTLLDRPVFPVRAADFWRPKAYGTGAEDFNGNGSLDAGEDLNANGVLDQLGDIVFRPNDVTQSIAYRCVASGTSSTSQVGWPTVPGQRVVDGGVTWEAFDNRVGLQKIRITVRLRDPIEGLPRQFSIVHSFANPK